VLSGNIGLVIQSPTITQANTTVVVTGSILNEGFSSAYYASVTGSLSGARRASDPDYVGEVDPNTPIPFSVTIGYSPQSTPNQKANVTVAVSYTDSLGQSGKYLIVLPTTLRSASQLLQGQGSGTTVSSSGADSLTYLEYGVVAALVAVALVGVVYIRRNRASVVDGEQLSDHKADHEVI
jgi:hypothetical protein